jgi:hypothetical protein
MIYGTISNSSDVASCNGIGWCWIAQTTYFKIRIEITAAIVGRLTFGGNIIETGTKSYLLANTPTAAEVSLEPFDNAHRHRINDLLMRPRVAFVGTKSVLR